jgi:hypothetical protein
VTLRALVATALLVTPAAPVAHGHPPVAPPLFPSLRGLVPGEVRTGRATIRNDGARGFYVLSVRTAGSRLLLARVRVRIESRGRVLYAGSLAAIDRVPIGYVGPSGRRTLVTRAALTTSPGAGRLEGASARITPVLSVVARP